MRILAIFSGTVLTVLLAATAQAFCGFYVAKADASLFKVRMARSKESQRFWIGYEVTEWI